MFIARHLERVGDHATDIAEDAVYAVGAEDIRHQQVAAQRGSRRLRKCAALVR